MDDYQRAVFDKYLAAGQGDFIGAAPNFKKMFAGFRRNYGEFLPTDPAAKILDLGCGWGTFLQFLAEENFENLTGIDASDENLARAKTLTPRAFFKKVDDPAAWLGERPGEFDLIVLNDVLEHFQKPQIIPLLAAIRAALRPGGRAIIKVPNMANPLNLPVRYCDFTHEVGFTRASLEQVLRLAGFFENQFFGFRTHTSLRSRAALGFVTAALRRILWLFMIGRAGGDILEPSLVAVATRD